MPRDLTVEKVIEDLGISRETVYRWLRSGKLKGYRLGGTKAGWRIPESELERIRRPLDRSTAVADGAES